MKYEIINPSDQCYVFADDERVAAASIILLGEGMYGGHGEDGKSIPCFYPLGGDYNADWKEKYGITLEAYLELPDARPNLAKCYDSFIYAGERSSLNNIGARAKHMAEVAHGQNKKGE